MAAGGSIDALSQFKLEPSLGVVGASVNFTQANLMMVVAGLLTFGLLWVGMRPRAMVPGRLQSAAEMAYEAVLGMCTETIGPEGRVIIHPATNWNAETAPADASAVLHSDGKAA